MEEHYIHHILAHRLKSLFNPSNVRLLLTITCKIFDVKFLSVFIKVN